MHAHMPLSQKKKKHARMRPAMPHCANIAAPLPEFRELGYETIEEELQEGKLYRT